MMFLQWSGPDDPTFQKAHLKMDVVTAIRRSRLVLPMALLAAAVMLFISEGSYMRAVAATDSLRGMAEARAQIRTLLQGVVDAETGQRGYLLTDRKEYLLPYQNALDQIGKSFEFLRNHYQPDANEQQNLGHLQTLTLARLSVLAETIRLKSESKGDLAADVLMSGIGDEQMAAIRARAAEMLAREDARVQKRRDAIYDNLLLNRIGVAALTLFSLLALVLYLRRSAASDRQQVEQQRLLLAERDRLEVLVAQRTEVLTELTRHLSSAREDERGRLARELHDELGALLTSAKLDAARIKSRLAGIAPDALERLAHLVETLNSGIALKRRIIEDLRPSALSNLGLVATLEILTQSLF